MKIKVKPGVVVRLDRRRNTGRQGGEYDISELSEQDRARALATEGVTQISGQKGGKSAPKVEEAK